MNTTIIYGLVDPLTKQLRYIGKSNNPNLRLKDHITKSKRKITHKDNWIYSLLNNSYKPELIIIDTVLVNEWKYWELFYVSYFKYIGCDLTNHTIGGDGLTFGNQTSFKKDNGNIALYQIDLNGNIIKEWKSQVELKNKLGFKLSHGTDKIGRTVHGFIFFKKETWDNLSKEQKNNIILSVTDKKYDKIKNNNNVKKTQFKKNQIPHNIVKVAQLDLNNNIINIFNSIKDAQKITGASKISLVINGHRNTSGGYKWIKYE